MVILIPNNNNPTRKEIDAFICKMLESNFNDILNCIIREINDKSCAGALLHPAEEYFINSAKNMSLEDLQLPDQHYSFDMEHNGL